MQFAVIKKHVPTILAVVASVGVVTTAIFSGKASIRAYEIIAEKEKEKGEKLTKKEKVIATAPTYTKTVIFGGATIASIVACNLLNRKQIAALAGAYVMVESTYRTYRGKLKDIYGKEADDRIMAAMAEDAEPVNNYAPGAFWCCNLSAGPEGEPITWYDSLSNRKFELPLCKVLEAEYHLNRNFALGGQCAVNELYDFLGLTRMDGCDNIGWFVDPENEVYWIDFNHEKVTLDDGMEYYVIETPYGPFPLEDMY